MSTNTNNNTDTNTILTQRILDFDIQGLEQTSIVDEGTLTTDDEYPETGTGEICPQTSLTF